MDNSQYREIFNLCPAPMVLVDSQGFIQELNHQAAELYGYEKSELVGKSVEILIPPEGRDAHDGLRKNFFEFPRSGSIDANSERFGLKKDGSRFPMEVHFPPLQTPVGTMAISSIVDITYRLKAEEKFRTAVEAAPNGVVMVDRQGLIVLVNAQVQAMFGYGKAELLGQSVSMLVPITSRDHHGGYVESYMRSPTPRAMGGGRELFGRRKDGSKFPVEVGLRPFHGSDGLYVIGSIVDITERLKDREKLYAQNEELQQFTYRTSHDLKAPLITISGLAEFIAEDAKNGEVSEAVKNAEKIMSIAERLKVLLEDILSLTKADYSDEPFSSIAWNDIISASPLKLEILTRDNGVKILTDLNHTVDLKSRPLIISHIIDNLLSNGIKYADRKKNNSFVFLRTYNHEDSFYIEVEDNGLGIPAEKKNEVFGMFKRFHKEYTLGSGLGLYLVKKHVTKLGGEISFANTGEGTLFVVKLPIRP